MRQQLKQRLGWYLRGLAMGAADVVPGVSGGTVAFITGIYERLLAALASFDPGAWRALRRGGAAAAWRHVDGTFLLLVLAGIVTSIITLARLIGLALEQYPIPLWSFFFGLILGSTVHIARRIDAWHGAILLALPPGEACEQPPRDGTAIDIGSPHIPIGDSSHRWGDGGNAQTLSEPDLEDIFVGPFVAALRLCAMLRAAGSPRNGRRF